MGSEARKELEALEARCFKVMECILLFALQESLDLFYLTGRSDLFFSMILRS